jgi:hypothetical protein
VIWNDNRTGDWGIYYKNSSDSGVTWSSDYRLSNVSDYEYTPAIVASGSNIHVVWDDDSDGNYKIYYKNSSDSGITWSPDYQLTYLSSASNGPKITVSNPYIHLVWKDVRDGNNEIYYKRFNP